MRRSLSRLGVAIVLSALLVVGAVLPAAADGPVDRWPAFFGTTTITDMCSFPVDFAVLKQSKTITVWQDSDGTIVAHGAGGGLYTWSAHGITLTTQLHGNIVEVYPPDGSGTVTWTGNHVVPPLGIMMRGRTQIHWDSLGNVTVSTSNHSESICAALTP